MNNKGFTLIELMATIFIISLIMAVTIPNVAGIFQRGKIVNYGDDAKKLRNTAEYLYRGYGSMNNKLVNNNSCIVFSMRYLDNDELNPPYEGTYLDTKSFVVIKKENKRLKYYIQLLELLPEGGVRGYKLLESTLLDDSGYIDNLGEWNSDAEFVDLNGIASATLMSHSNFSPVGCSSIVGIFNS